MRRQDIGVAVSALALVVYASGCHGHEHGGDDERGHAGETTHDDEAGHEGGHGHAPGALAITHWTDLTELFVEFPPLVVREESPFAAHMTRLSDFASLSRGTVIVTLSGGAAPDEKFEAEDAKSPGIFRPVAVPKHAGPRSMTLAYRGEGIDVIHDLGQVEVFADRKAVPHEDEAEENGSISFLKEQQWKIPFGTTPVIESEMRASVQGYGTLRPRGDGVIEISATVSGRLATSNGGFPVVGKRVDANDVLAWLAPRSSASADPASLDLAVTRARLGLETAKRDRIRLEQLLEKGAVSEKRVQDARQAESSATAEMKAAEQRMGQHRGQQSSRVAGSIAVRAGLSGTVLAVHAAPGSFIEEGAPLFEVADLERLWLVVAVPAVHAAQVTSPKGVWFEVEGVEEPMSLGSESLVAVAGALDPKTRTLSVTYVVPNSERKLRPGMYARAHVVIADSRQAPAIPISAVVDDGGTDVVYVQADGETFERRVLRVGVRDRELVEIKGGLALGERVVSRGALTVKLASMSTALPAHGHAH